MKRLIGVVCVALCVFACSKKNPTVRTDILNQAQDHLNVGVTEFKKGNYSTASLFLDQALGESQSIDNIPLQVRVMLSIGELEIAQGQFAQASNHIFTAWQLADISEIPVSRFNLFATTGKFYAKTSNFIAAIENYEMAIRNTSDPAQEAIIYNNIGNVYRRMGEYDHALTYLGRATRINWAKKIYDQLAGNYFNTGELYLQQEQTVKAMNNYLLALKYDKIAENSVGVIEDLKRLAECAFKLEKYDAAQIYLSRALNVAQNIRLTRQVAIVRELLTKYRAPN
jgi:tetratricopeptide (TPR) repeat protein